MFNPLRCTFLGLRRPLCSSTAISLIRHASSKQATLVPVLQQQRGKLLDTSPMLLMRERSAPIKCWVDASIKNGLIAVVIENYYKVFHTKLQEGIAGRNIHWAESVAFELLVHILLAQRFSGSVMVYSDSQAALGAFNGLKSRDHLVAASGARLQAQRPLWPFQIRSEWVASKHNVADPFTRGKPVAFGYEELRCYVKLSETLKSFVHQN